MKFIFELLTALGTSLVSLISPSAKSDCCPNCPGQPLGYTSYGPTKLHGGKQRWTHRATCQRCGTHFIRTSVIDPKRPQNSKMSDWTQTRKPHTARSKPLPHV